MKKRRKAPEPAEDGLRRGKCVFCEVDVVLENHGNSYVSLKGPQRTVYHLYPCFMQVFLSGIGVDQKKHRRALKDLIRFAPQDTDMELAPLNFGDSSTTLAFLHMFGGELPTPFGADDWRVVQEAGLKRVGNSRITENAAKNLLETDALVKNGYDRTIRSYFDDYGEEVPAHEDAGYLMTVAQNPSEVIINELPVNSILRIHISAEQFSTDKEVTLDLFLQHGYTMPDLIDLGFNIKQLVVIGLTVDHLADKDRFPPRDLVDVGLNYAWLTQLCDNDIDTFSEIGYSCRQLRELEIPFHLLRRFGLNAKNLKRFPFTPKDWKSLGMTVDHLEEMEVDVNILRETGWKATELKREFPAYDLDDNSYSKKNDFAVNDFMKTVKTNQNGKSKRKIDRRGSKDVNIIDL